MAQPDVPGGACAEGLGERRQRGFLFRKSNKRWIHWQLGAVSDSLKSLPGSLRCASMGRKSPGLATGRARLARSDGDSRNGMATSLDQLVGSPDAEGAEAWRLLSSLSIGSYFISR